MKTSANFQFCPLSNKLIWLLLLILGAISACDPEALEEFERNDELSTDDCVEYKIQSAIGLQYLEAQGAQSTALVKIAPLAAATASAQRWFLTPSVRDFYMVKSDLGKYLDVQWGNAAAGTPVHMYEYLPNQAQNWKFIRDGDHYYIQSELGTYLSVQDGAAGGNVVMQSFTGTDAQKWKIQLVESTKRMTNFKPAEHGFKFKNDFKISFPILGLNAEFGGQCGGMVYAALDYYEMGVAIPSQTYRPAARTTLANYIYDRQQTSSFSNADKWAELVLNPLGLRTQEFFNWGLQGINTGDRISELKRAIDAGNPVPLGLFKAGNGGFGPHHQVLAIGYDMRRYRGDLGDFKEDFRIFIYDPNYPLQKVTLVANPATQSYYYTEYPDKTWMTYFVDGKYAPQNAPAIIHNDLPDDGLVRKLLLEIRTGGDDLRGGNDNVHAVVNLNSGSDQIYYNINNFARWPDNYTETVEISLTTPVPLSNIQSVTLKTTFGGGIGGDNWNVDGFRIIALEGDNISTEAYAGEGTPLVRFTGTNTPFVAMLR